MKRVVALAIAMAFLVLACARDEQRAARYDGNECPFCTADKGSCTYCKSSGKCNFCSGTGKRVTVVPKLSQETALPVSYEEACPYCNSSGVCRHCYGQKKCFPCDGTGKVGQWNFLEKYQQQGSVGAGS